MITLEETYHASDYETWFAYWKQCRVATVYFKFAPGYTGEDNPLQIRFREIPEGEDMTKPHPDIEVQIIESQTETYCVRALLDALPEDSVYKTFSLIEKSTQNYYDTITKREKEFNEWQEYKKNGNLTIETVDETKPITWESIRNASTEELFQTKLEIFESPPVQETNKKEYRSAVRKSSSIIEAMYWYYLIVNEGEEDGARSKMETIPEDINSLLIDIPSESIFKWKLQIFEREEVQNSENKRARSKIRKANNLVELFSAYNELDESDPTTPTIAEKFKNLNDEEKEELRELLQDKKE